MCILNTLNSFERFFSKELFCTPKVMPSVGPIRELTKMALASAPLTATVTAALHASSAILLNHNVPLQKEVAGGTASVALPV